MQGNSLSKDSLLKHGVYEYYLDNGLKENIITYKNNLMHGFYNLYYASGILKETGFHKEDKLVGKNIQYFENGNIRRKAKLKNGKYHGKMVYYNEIGNKIGEGRCRDDVWDGKWVKYDNSGNKITGIFYGTVFKLKDCRINVKLNNYIWSLFDKEKNLSYDSYLMRCVSSVEDRKNPITRAPELRLLIIDDKDVFDNFYKEAISKESYKFDFNDKDITLEESFVLGVDNDLSEKANVLVLKFKNGQKNFIIETPIDVDNAKRNEEILEDIIGGMSGY